MSARVLLHFKPNGGFAWLATGEVEVVCVDDNAPGDRVYRTVGQFTDEEFDEITDKAIRCEAYE